MKNSILLIILSMAVTFVAARDAISPFMGDVFTYQVENHAGSEYQWQVFQELTPLTVASPSAYQFINSNNTSSVAIKWFSEGVFYLMVQETDNGGCSNLKAIRIEVLPNNTQLAFTSFSSTQCYQSNNDFAIGLQFTEKNGDALAQDRFPVNVSYSVNGVTQPAQTIDYFNQQLQVKAPAFTADPTQNTNLSVALIAATDHQNLMIQAQTGQDTHLHTIAALPQISSIQGSESFLLGEKQSFSAGGQESWLYEWALVLPDGAEVSLNSSTPQSEEITFSQTGTYQLRVRATNLENCQSDWAIKSITVNGLPEEIPTPVAIPDINLTWVNTTVSGNVATNDLFYVPGQTELDLVTVPLEAAGRLTAFNKTTGNYTFVPANGFSGEAIFQYKICTLVNGVMQCTSAAVTIQVLQPADNMPPVANDDVFVLFSGDFIQGNFLLNDFDPEGGALRISQTETSNLPGVVDWSADGAFKYSPTPGFSGQVHFNYAVCDEVGHCDWATVAMYVFEAGKTDKNLFATDQVFYTKGLISGSLAANNHHPAGNGLTYQTTPVKGPSNGVVTIQADGNFVYTPNPGATGQIVDQFIYEVCSSNEPAECSRATVYITGNISDPVIVVRSNFETGSCLPIVLDASKSSGAGALSFHWEPALYLSDPADSKPLFTPGQSTNYQLTATDAHGNSSTKEVLVSVAPAPVIVADKQVFVNKATDAIMLDASASSGAGLTYQWTADNTGVIVSGANTATPQVSGLGKYYIQLTDQYGCTALDSVMVGLLVQVNAMNDTVGIRINTFADINVLRNDLPKGQLDPRSVTIVSPPKNGFASIASDSIITYTPNQFYVGQDHFVYSVCDYTSRCDEATVLVMINDEALFVPNAFSPNGDGINDYFEILGTAKYQQVSLKVYNRWGNLVYESVNYGPAGDGFWDGKANKGARLGNGDLAGGTYFYTLDLDNGTERVSGFIYLDR